MNQILIIAHEPLAQAFRAAALHVFPDCGDRVHALDVLANEAPEQTLERARLLLQDVACAGTLVMTDVLGATPCNVVSHMLERQGAIGCKASLRGVTGLNLPMLLRAVCYAGLTLEEMQERALSGGAQGIMPLACNLDACSQDVKE
jgi:PTS system ascorbate-specific IIA component